MRLREFCIEDAGERCGDVAVDFEDGVGHVSYLVAAHARGRGLATKALSEFVAWTLAHHTVAREITRFFS